MGEHFTPWGCGREKKVKKRIKRRLGSKDVVVFEVFEIVSENFRFGNPNVMKVRFGDEVVVKIVEVDKITLVILDG